MLFHSFSAVLCILCSGFFRRFWPPHEKNKRGKHPKTIGFVPGVFWELHLLFVSRSFRKFSWSFPGFVREFILLFLSGSFREFWPPTQKNKTWKMCVKIYGSVPGVSWEFYLLFVSERFREFWHSELYLLFCLVGFVFVILICSGFFRNSILVVSAERSSHGDMQCEEINLSDTQKSVLWVPRSNSLR